MMAADTMAAAAVAGATIRASAAAAASSAGVATLGGEVGAGGFCAPGLLHSWAALRCGEAGVCTAPLGWGVAGGLVKRRKYTL